MEELVRRKAWRALTAAALTVTVLLSGCGGGVPDRSPDIEPDPEEVADVPEVIVPEVRPSIGLTPDMEYHYDEDAGAVVNSMVTELPGLDAPSREEYPALADALDRFRETALANAREAYQEREAILPDITGTEDAVQALGGEVRSMVRRADAQAVSVVNYWWDYSGGAHASYGYGAVNFDTATGAEITLDDLLTDEGRLTINSRVSRELDAVYTELSPGEMVADYLSDDYTFSIEPDGVTFWFNPYEIASYADGLLTVKLYFDADADVLKPDYAGHHDAWFVEIGTEIPYRFGGTHSAEAWTVQDAAYPEWNNGFGIEFDAPAGSDRWADRLTSADDDSSWDVPDGRNIVLDQTGSFDVQFYYAHISGGDFVVALPSMENDANDVILYRSDGTLISVLSLTATAGFTYPEPPADYGDVDDWSLYDSYALALTNPYGVPLRKRFDLFGTWGGAGTYRLTPDGFELMDAFLYCNGGYVLTLKQDLTVTRRAADNWAVSTDADETLPAGTQVEVLAADEAGTAYFRALDVSEDNTDFIFALSYDSPDEWPRTVDGVPEDELFDGLLYAG